MASLSSNNRPRRARAPAPRCVACPQKGASAYLAGRRVVAWSPQRQREAEEENEAGEERRAHLSDLALAERLGREGAPGHPGRSLECSLRKHDSLCFVLSPAVLELKQKAKTIKKLIFDISIVLINFLLPEVHSHHLDSRLERCRVARTSTSHRHTSSQCHQTSSAEPRRGKTIASVTRTSGC